MREAVRLWALLLIVVFPAVGQVETAKLTIRAILVDKDLNQKPIPRLSVSLSRSDVAGTEPYTARTNFDGVAELQVPPGQYHLSTSEPVEFQGKKYSWEMDLTVSSPGTAAELSNDNAKSIAAPAEKPTRVVDDLAQLFKKYQNSVVTVWSEVGHGTGFVVGAEGLILTNQHVIGPSELISVQFDPKRKVAAKLVAFDAERDIAVLWASLAPFPEVVVAPLAKSKAEESSVVEGERVFTIGSPLSQQKILTTGIVSKVEPRAIISDININPGNSGGPLFSSLGTVVGLTTFGEHDKSGPGISGIVRIEEAEQLLQRAKTKMRDISPPQPALLPVEPSGTYPIDALKTSLQKAKFDERPYTFGEGNYDVAVVTPVLKYHYAEGARVQAEKEKEKRTKKSSDAVVGTFRPLDDLRNWAEYAGEYRPVIFIQASPKLRETTGSMLLRGLASANGGYGGPARMRFKTDFYRMKLLCGDKEIQPIQPGKITSVVNVHNPFVNVTDATYEGLYVYPYDAISSDCANISLQIFSEKEPDKPETKILDPKTVAQVVTDFEPFRKGQIELSPTPNAPN